MKILLLILVLAFCTFGQDLPIYGDLKDIAKFSKVYVIATENDGREDVLNSFKREKRFTVVGNPAEAEFFFEIRELSKLVNNREYQERHEGTVYFFTPDKKKIIAWSDTETYYQKGSMVLSASNEWNLVRNFHKAFKKATK